MGSSDTGPLRENEIDQWLTSHITEYDNEHRLGLLGVERNSDAALLGYCGLTVYPDIDGVAETEIGYRLIRSAWGHGYATEAATAVRDHAFTVLKLNRLVALIEPDNRRSFRVAEKLGMSFEREVMLDGYDHPDLLYAIHYVEDAAR